LKAWTWPVAVGCFGVLNALNLYWSFEFVRPKKDALRETPTEASKNGGLKQKGA
jgi:hypothetical protein